MNMDEMPPQMEGMEDAMEVMDGGQMQDDGQMQQEQIDSGYQQ